MHPLAIAFPGQSKSLIEQSPPLSRKIGHDHQGKQRLPRSHQHIARGVEQRIVLDTGHQLEVGRLGIADNRARRILKTGIEHRVDHSGKAPDLLHQNVIVSQRRIQHTVNHHCPSVGAVKIGVELAQHRAVAVAEKVDLVLAQRVADQIHVVHCLHRADELGPAVQTGQTGFRGSLGHLRYCRLVLRSVRQRTNHLEVLGLLVAVGVQAGRYSPGIPPHHIEAGQQPLRQPGTVAQESLKTRSRTARIHQQRTDPVVGVGCREHPELQGDGSSVGIVVIGRNFQLSAEINLPAVLKGQGSLFRLNGSGPRLFGGRGFFGRNWLLGRLGHDRSWRCLFGRIRRRGLWRYFRRGGGDLGGLDIRCRRRVVGVGTSCCKQSCNQQHTRSNNHSWVPLHNPSLVAA